MLGNDLQENEDVSIRASKEWLKELTFDTVKPYLLERLNRVQLPQIAVARDNEGSELRLMLEARTIKAFCPRER